MCGIAGFNWEDAAVLRRMTDALAHRGPDATGTYFEAGRLSLGHRRLSIVDLHERSTQPLAYSHAGRAYELVFNGEIYNYQPLRRELTALGCAFQTTGDSEVILAAYAVWGERCVERFNGMWAFALYDHAARTLFLSRDRFGKKPLYYYAADGRFAFASEIKAILEAPGVRRVADTERVSDLLTFGLVGHTERTFFRDVRQLPAGSNGLLDLGSGRLRIRRYYELPTSERSVSPEELRVTLRDAVERRLISDVPTCLSLSGGIDSSAVAALIAERHQDRMVAFTTTSPTGIGDETANVEQLLARYSQFELVKVPLALDDFPTRLRRMIWHMDEPFIYDSPFGRWSIAEAIHRNGFKVSLTGEGADETLGGYAIASPLFLLDLARRRHFVRLASELVHTFRQPDWRQILARFASQFVERRRRRVYEYFIDNARRSGSRLAPSGTGAPLQEYDVTLKEKLRTEITTFFLPYLLACNDKMYMAHSVEARAPFLDVEVVELCLAVATEELIEHGVRKHPLRAAMRGRVPDAILADRRKIGFASPMRAEFASPVMQDTVRELFAEPRSEPYLDPARFLSEYRALSPSQSINDFFANAVTLELWMREFDVVAE